MNRLHRFFRPAGSAASRLMAPGSAAGIALPGDRASLQGLEVSDSSWDEWMQVQQEVQQQHPSLALGPAPTRAHSLQ